MGNLTFIVPTKRIEDFNIKKVFKLLKNNFKKLKIDLDDDWNYISVYKNKTLITELYFNQKCYLNFESDELELRNNGMIELADKLNKLNKSEPDLNNVIQTTYGIGVYSDVKNDVDFLLKDYFSAYIFDEGIHPEFIPPDYEKKKKGFFSFFDYFMIDKY